MKPRNSHAKKRAHPRAHAVASAPTDQQNAQFFSKFHRIGVMSWSAIGVILFTVLVAGGISALSGILVPLAIAVILGTVLEPITTWLTRHGMSRMLAATLVLTATIVAATAIAIAVVYGFIQQIPEISRQMQLGWIHLMEWLRSLNINPAWVEQLQSIIDGTISRVGQGAFGVVAGTVYATVMFSVGTSSTMPALVRHHVDA